MITFCKIFWAIMLIGSFLKSDAFKVIKSHTTPKRLCSAILFVIFAIPAILCEDPQVYCDRYLNQEVEIAYGITVSHVFITFLALGIAGLFMAGAGKKDIDERGKVMKTVNTIGWFLFTPWMGLFSGGMIRMFLMEELLALVPVGIVLFILYILKE